MRDTLIHLDRRKDVSIQAQIREKLVEAILGGQILPESPLPSSRKMAKTLGVSRNTVVLAFQGLVDDGYLVSRERSGFYVSDEIAAMRSAASPAKDDGPVEPKTRRNWPDRFRLHPSRQINIEKPRNWMSYNYPFVYGQVDRELFPIAAWRECTRLALGRRALDMWTSDAHSFDDPALVTQIQTRLLPRRGILADEDQILVTLGSQNALYLLSTLLTTDRSVVGMESPGYRDAYNIFSLRTENVKPIPVDDLGLPVDDRLDDCDYVFVTPSHQFPTTVTLPLERRRALLKKASEKNFVIIEDDYEFETSYLNEPTPALKSLDTDDRVIYVGSLSKTLFPGLRLGYLVGSAEMIKEARALRRLVLRHPPANNQHTTALFLSQGHHDSLVGRLHREGKIRWTRMGEALAKYLPQSSRVPTFGGTSYWVRGPVGLDAEMLAAEAMEEGVLIEPGQVYFFENQPHTNYFRLGFSSIAVEKIEPGIRLLADLIRRHMEARGGN